MGSFAFTLEQENGTPADPPTPQAAVPNWRQGDVIALGAGRSLRVIDAPLREGSDGDPVMVLVVGPALGQPPSTSNSRLAQSGQ
jgi:hypothetical protein